MVNKEEAFLLNFSSVVNDLEPLDFQSLVNFLLWCALADPEVSELEGQLRSYSVMGKDRGIDGLIWGRLKIQAFPVVEGKGIVCIQHIRGIDEKKSEFNKAKQKLEKDLEKLKKKSDRPDFVIFATAAPLLPQQDKELQALADEIWGDKGKVYIVYFDTLRNWFQKYLGKDAINAFSKTSGVWIGSHLVQIGLEKPEDLPVPKYYPPESYFQPLLGREHHINELLRFIKENQKRGLIINQKPFAGGTSLAFAVIKKLVEDYKNKFLPLYIQENAPEPSEKTRSWLIHLSHFASRINAIIIIFIDAGSFEENRLQEWINTINSLLGKKGKVILIGHDIRVNDLKKFISKIEPNPKEIKLERLSEEDFFKFLKDRRILLGYQHWIAKKCDKLPGMLDLLLSRSHPAIPDEVIKKSVEETLDKLQNEYVKDIGISPPRTKQLLALIAVFQPLPENIEKRALILSKIREIMRLFYENDLPEKNQLENAIQKLIKIGSLELRGISPFIIGYAFSPRFLTIFSKYLEELFPIQPEKRAEVLFNIIKDYPEKICENLTWVCEERLINKYKVTCFPLLEEASKYLLKICMDSKQLNALRKEMGIMLYNIMEELAKRAPKQIFKAVQLVYNTWKQVQEPTNEFEELFTKNETLDLKNLYKYQSQLPKVIRKLLENSFILSTNERKELFRILLEIHIDHPGRENDYNSPQRIISDYMRWKIINKEHWKEEIDFSIKKDDFRSIKELFKEFKASIKHDKAEKFLNFFTLLVQELTNPRLETGTVLGHKYVFFTFPPIAPAIDEAVNLINDVIDFVFKDLHYFAIQQRLFSNIWDLFFKIINNLFVLEERGRIQPRKDWLPIAENLLNKVIDLSLEYKEQEIRDLSSNYLEDFFKYNKDYISEHIRINLEKAIIELKSPPFKGFNLLLDAQAFWDVEFERRFKNIDITPEEFLENALEKLSLLDDKKASKTLKEWLKRGIRTAQISKSQLSPALDLLVSYIQKNRPNVISILLSEIISELKHREVSNYDVILIIGFVRGSDIKNKDQILEKAKQLLNLSPEIAGVLLPLMIQFINEDLLKELSEEALQFIIDLRNKLQESTVKDIAIRELVISLKNLYQTSIDKNWQQRIESEIKLWLQFLEGTKYIAQFYMWIDIFANGERQSPDFVGILSIQFLEWYRDAMDNSQISLEYYHAASYLAREFSKDPINFYDAYFSYRVNKAISDKKRPFPYGFLDLIAREAKNVNQQSLIKCVKKYLEDFPNFYPYVSLDGSDWLVFWDNHIKDTQTGLPFSSIVKKIFEEWMNANYDPCAIYKDEQGININKNKILEGWKWWAIPILLRSYDFDEKLCEFLYPLIKKCDDIIIDGTLRKGTIGQRFLTELMCAIATTRYARIVSYEKFLADAEKWRSIRELHPESIAWKWLFDSLAKEAEEDARKQKIEEEEIF